MFGKMSGFQNQKEFKDYHAELCSSMDEQQLKTFADLKCNEDRILFISNIEKCPMNPVKWELYRGKNIGEARHLKNEGNKQFQNENYKKAFWYYSQSILKSSPDLPEFLEILPICYANRSATLYHLHQYDEAIKDIDIALKNNYPRNLAFKLFDRKARCLLALQKLSMACNVFKQTIQALDEAKLSTERTRKWQTDIQIMLLMLKKKEESNSCVQSPISENKLQKNEEVKYPNSKYEAITSAIEIKFSDEMGRFAEAKANIKAGDTLLVEKPHCAVLLSEYKSTHCYHCFKRVKILYSCPTCDDIIFCSEECTKNAVLSYHRVECPILPTLWRANLSITCLMALRIICQKEVEYFLGRRHAFKDLKSRDRESCDYKSIYNLVHHEAKRKPGDLMNRIHVALFLLQCLKHTSYFTKEPGTGTFQKLLQNDNELYITELLVHHLQILQFNAHEVSELQVQNSDIESATSTFIGGALYPTLALFNHSCNPGIVRYFKGTKVVVKAIRNISIGQMVAENYGPIFTEMTKTERQNHLRTQYWFTCSCEACTNNWITLAEMSKMDNMMRFRCINKECNSLIEINTNNNNFIVKCAVCSQNSNILKALKSLQDTDFKFTTAKNLMRNNKINKATEELLKILNLFDEVLIPPFKDYYLCQQALRTCYLTMGNCFIINSV